MGETQGIGTNVPELDLQEAHRALKIVHAHVAILSEINPQKLSTYRNQLPTGGEKEAD